MNLRERDGWGWGKILKWNHLFKNRIEKLRQLRMSERELDWNQNSHYRSVWLLWSHFIQTFFLSTKLEDRVKMVMKFPSSSITQTMILKSFQSLRWWLRKLLFWSLVSGHRKLAPRDEAHTQALREPRCCLVTKLCLTLFTTPWTVACPATVCLWDSQARTLEWVAISQGDLPDPCIESMSPTSPALLGRFFTTEPRGKLRAQSCHQNRERFLVTMSAPS